MPSDLTSTCNPALSRSTGPGQSTFPYASPSNPRVNRDHPTTFGLLRPPRPTEFLCSFSRNYWLVPTRLWLLLEGAGDSMSFCKPAANRLVADHGCHRVHLRTLSGCTPVGEDSIEPLIVLQRPSYSSHVFCYLKTSFDASRLRCRGGNIISAMHLSRIRTGQAFERAMVRGPRAGSAYIGLGWPYSLEWAWIRVINCTGWMRHWIWGARLSACS